ncbi:putative ATP-dependent RNA helicase ddx56, partial [Clydaea vesicula]
MGLVISILSKKPKNKKGVNYLFILPTRYLAFQVYNWILQLLPKNLIKVETQVQLLVSGISSFENQLDLIKNVKPKILVGTSNKLLEIYESGGFNGSKIETIVLDEVDKLVNYERKYDTVNKKYIKKIHPHPTEVLVDLILNERNLLNNNNLTEQKPDSNIRNNNFKKKNLINYNDNKTEDNDKNISFQNNQKNEKTIQFIVSSATLDRQLQFNLKKRNWIDDKIELNFSGDQSVPETVTHHCLVVTKDGQLRDMKRELEKYKPNIIPSSTNETILLDNIAEKNELSLKVQQEKETALPDDHDFVLDAIKLISKDVLANNPTSKGIIFLHSSISTSRICERLNNETFFANRIFLDVDTSDSKIENNNNTKIDDTKDPVENSKKKINTTLPKDKTLSNQFFGNGNTLICIDEYSSRGLDLPEVDLVFILGKPSSFASYLHMSGRTGRMGKK